MTLSTQTSKAAYAGNGVSTVFPLPFPFLREADLKALLRQDGVETELFSGTHYTLSGAGSAGSGSLTMLAPPAAGQTLVIWRAPEIVQEVDYVENAAFPAETHEAALDLLTMICQSLQEQIGRAVLYPVSTPDEDILDSSDFLQVAAQSRDAATAGAASAEAASVRSAASAAEAATSAAEAAASAATAAEAVGGGVVRVSGSDTTAGTLSTKLTAGDGLAESLQNPGGAESLRLSVALADSPGLEFASGLMRVQAGAGLALDASGLRVDVGVGAGQLVQLDASARLPAVDGSQLVNLPASGTPVGTIIAVASEDVPGGYLECDGSAVSTAAYQDLADSFGRRLTGVSRYGAASVSVTANATTDIFTSASPHGFSVGDTVRIAGTTQPGGVVATTNYSIISTNFTSTTFSVSATKGATTALNVTTAGVGVTATRDSMLSKAAHGLSIGDRVALVGTVPGTLTVGTSYYVADSGFSADTFSLAATAAGQEKFLGGDVNATANTFLWGYGDGTTTFNLPDLRGRFLRGWDHAVGRDPDRASRTACNTGGPDGDNVGTVQADAYKSHTHTYQADSAGTAGSSGVPYIGYTYGALPSTQASGGNETRPVNAGVMYCIKY